MSDFQYFTIWHYNSKLPDRYPKSKAPFGLYRSGDLSRSLCHPQISGIWPLERQNQSIFGRLCSLSIPGPKLAPLLLFRFREKNIRNFVRVPNFCDELFLKRENGGKFKRIKAFCQELSIIRENCVLTGFTVGLWPSNIVLPRSFVARENERSRARPTCSPG